MEVEAETNPSLKALPQVILLNGASSSGKTTLCKTLKEMLPAPYFYLSSDQLVDSGALPNVDRQVNDTPWSWNILRPTFFSGFHKSIAAFAHAGNCILVEHIVEHPSWLQELVLELKDFHVFYVGVFCPIEEIRRREQARGDRYIGEGESHIADGIHTWSDYDLSIDTTKLSPKENAQLIVDSIQKLQVEESVFRRLLKNHVVNPQFPKIS